MAPSLDDQFSIDEEDREACRDPQPKIVILTHRESLVKEADFRKKNPTHERGRRADNAKGKTFFENPTRVLGMS